MYNINTKFSIIITFLLFLNFNFKTNAQGVDVVFLLDISQSIDNAEYSNMKNTVDILIDEVIGCSSYNRGAVVSYGSEAVNNNKIYIESDFTNNINELKNFPRRNLGQYDNASEGLMLVDKALSILRDDAMVSPVKNLNFFSTNKVVVFLFTDSEYRTSTGNISTLLNLRNSNLYYFYNEFKSSYFKPEIVVVRSSLNDISKDNLANTAAAAISSVGGNYNGTVAANSGDPQGSGIKPRKFTYVSNFTLTSTEIVNVKNQICRTCSPVVKINDLVPSSQTVCLNSTPTSLKVDVNGTGTISYQWYRNSTNSTTGGTIITGATSSSYTPPTNTAGNWFYYVIVTDSSCDNKTTSNSFKFTTLNQNCNCSITADIYENINNQVVCSLNNSSKLLTKATGNGTLSYQWYVNSESSYTGTPISGATSNNFQPEGFYGDIVYYYYEVTDSNCNIKTLSPIYTVYLDSDEDGIPNYLDLDSDNDGITDLEEGSINFYDTKFKIFNGGLLSRNEILSISLQFVGNPGTNVKVIGYNKTEFNYIIPASGILVQTYIQQGTIVPPKTSEIITEVIRDERYIEVIADQPIRVLQRTLEDPTTSEDIGIIFPRSIWGKKYTIPGVYCPTCITALNRNQMYVYTESQGVNIVVKDKNGVVTFSGPLNIGEFLNHAAVSDMSGYTVEANKDVAVIFIVNNGSAPFSTVDHMFEYLLPDRLLGRTFLTKSPGGQSKIVFVSTQDNTEIKRNGSVVHTLQTKGSIWEYLQSINSIDLFETNFPVQATKVTPYGTISNVNGAANLVRDPSITNILDVTKGTYGPSILRIPSVLTRENHISIYVNTKDIDKITRNGVLIPASSFVAFAADPNLSHTTITVSANTDLKIHSTTGKIPFILDYFGVGNAVSNATSIDIGPYDIRNGRISNISMKDTDGDGIPDYLDLDSDNDGCVDAIEGGDNVKLSDLVQSSSCLSVGIGSTAQNLNLCNSNNCVESNGVPSIVNPGGDADIDGEIGQNSGISDDYLVVDPLCANSNDPKCYKTPQLTGTPLSSTIGISSVRENSSQNWPMLRNGGFLTLESKTKGFVINRIATTANLNNISSPVEGMMVYDEEAKCIKVYTLKDGESNLSWHCMNTPACPDL